ncbi:chromosomal replication initiator protein DnaA [Bernardetia litoralis DSM 6794]|uniref:Chromosomal replication initiator protein DnaA n=1 Tax=Bernardetia litoralis (strain ATCC 23117 / DSM 6794 / NBRC 15988 / NCIMB 1366 / Fx l1 / Sio-4) TaxID=880071 RepID=I4AEX8_BERLS|nr:chromosomal replication initiator protein DnaA [Bernardetia litoralis]AFM02513.1 chromosomal replication initiator protein DnaA [Bernardetia litoralis DSM 6794]
MVSLSQQNTAISLNPHAANSGGYKDCQTVWLRCLEIIKTEIPEQSFNTWFMPIRPLRLRQNILTIQVPSLYFYEFLEEHYVLVLRKAIIEQLGTNGKLEYSLLPEKQQRPLFDTSFERNIESQNQQNQALQKNSFASSSNFTNNEEENSATASGQASLFQNQNSSQQNTNQKETDSDNPIILNGNSNYESATSRNQLNTNSNSEQVTRQGHRLEHEKENELETRQQTNLENRQSHQSNRTHQSAPQLQKSSNFQSSNSGQSYHQNQTQNRNKIQQQSDFRPVKTTQELPHNLNARYTFDTFVEGECNSVAFAAGRAIAKNPGRTSFHPLVLYGGVGLGKTHLAHAIGNRILEQYPEKRVVYVSADQFANDFVASVREQQITQFTEQYYHLDVLIVDDIQFLCDKVKTQESFFHIFNHLHSAGKQIIMTSDCAPAQMRGLQERLLSRFKWGAILDLKIPDEETRKAIIYTKLQGYESQVSLDVIDFLAKSVTTNVRELEGVITSLLAKSSLADMSITLDLARQALGAVVAHQNETHELSIDAIEEIVAAFFQVTLEQLKGKTRKKEIAIARQFAMYLTKEYTDLPLKAIGWHFGKRDHSTVIHACKVVPLKMEKEESYKKTFDEIIKRIEQL